MLSQLQPVVTAEHLHHVGHKTWTPKLDKVAAQKYMSTPAAQPQSPPLQGMAA